VLGHLDQGGAPGGRVGAPPNQVPGLIRRFTDSSARLIDLELRSQLAGRWRMASLSIIFAAIPAVIYLAAGLPVTAGTVSIGTLIAFTTLQNNLFRPVTGLLSTSRSTT
jgi:ATP-binding cassette, subfamily B, bacterial